VTDRVTVPGVICERSGWLAMAGDTCPLCGERTRHTPDVINELVERVIDEGGSILPVKGDTALGNRPVAAALRFPLPEIPGVTSARVGGHADAGA
jgi:peptide chain release factor subunit 1